MPPRMTVVPPYSKRDGENEMRMMGETWHGEPTDNTNDAMPDLSTILPQTLFISYVLCIYHYNF